MKKLVKHSQTILNNIYITLSLSNKFKLLAFATLSLCFSYTEHKNSNHSEIRKNKNFISAPCNIWEVKALNRSDCKNRGTDDHNDDYFEVDVLVEFVGDIPDSGNLVLIGTIGPLPPVQVSIPVSGLDGSWTFDDVELPAHPTIKYNIVLQAYFDANTNCTMTNPDAGPEYTLPPDTTVYRLQSTRQCSVCSGEGLVGHPVYPACWPPISTSPAITACNNPLNYCGNPNFVEETPIKYIKVVLHFFQRSDPNNPDNFTNSPAHMELIRTWFHEADDFYSNLCDSPNDDDDTPFVSDARIRFVFNGIEDEDVFFYQNDRAWGTGLSGCNNGNGLNDTQLFALAVDSRPVEIRNAFHIFVTGANWEDNAPLNVIDANDCFYYCPGGYTSGLTNCNPPYAVYSGRYHEYQIAIDSIDDDCNGTTQMDTTKIGLGFVGELFHYLSLDHLSPLQAHFAGGDFCDDTPLIDPFNKMDCGDGPRCALTCCQFGRIHYRMDNNILPLERFLVSTNPDVYSMTEPDYCNKSQPDLVIPTGQEIIWDYARQLSSDVVVPGGATLIIKCDVGLPLSAKIIVQAEGHLVVDDARLYYNCTGDTWDGIIVEGNASLGQLPTSNQGRVDLEPGTVIENARLPLTIKAGGIVLAEETEFLNCGTVTFHNYSKQNYSRFTDCQFVNNEDVGFSFTTNVSLTGVKGVQFKNCDFTVADISDSFSGTDKPTGILSLNSGFGVGTGSSFTGYYSGIRANGVGKNATVGFSVYATNFTDNFIGIDNSNVDNASIRNCIFENIGNYSPKPTISGVKPVGIQLRNCTAFNVTDNNFIDFSDITNDIGILAYNTGSDVNILRRNTFSDLYVADQAELNNVSQIDFTGLQYWCNSNSNNQFDFAVFNTGIGKEQGSGAATKNVFSYINSSSGDFKNESSGQINYYYQNATNEIPVNYSNIIPELVTKVVACTNIIEHTETDGVLDEGDEDFLDSVFTTTKSSYLTQLSYYHSLNGNPTAIAMEPELASQKAILHLVADRIIRSELADTTELDLPKIRTWLRNKESKESAYAIVETWLSESDSAHAVQVLDSIPIRHNLSVLDSVLHEHYKDWVELRISFDKMEKDIFDLDSADIELVEDMADADTIGIASTQARNLLDGAYGYDYRIHPKKPSTFGFAIMAPPSNGNIAISQAVEFAHVSAYPNPAKDLVKFKYKANSDMSMVWLTIYDVNGRIVSKILLQAAENTVEWKTDGLPAGVYYYKVTGVKSLPKKLVLIK